ncbi:MAG: LPS export ABC transporter periplasmic protein LptC [Chitinophagaceae bacterium]|nr:LPS export ABC transporter periplasmic protein LptC [Chitinophagaceae bacterium]
MLRCSLNKLIGYVLIACILCSCENDMGKVNALTNRYEASSETGKDIEVLYSDLGRIKSKLTAPTMLRFRTKEPYTELPDGLKILFFNENMQTESQLTAGYGISYEKSDEMKVRNDVEAVSVKGDKLNTEELVWNQKTQKISSDKAVTITTKDEIIFGDGFESNQDLSNYKIKKIRGTIRLKESSIPQ